MSQRWSFGKNVRPSQATHEVIIAFFIVITISSTCKIIGTTLVPPASHNPAQNFPLPLPDASLWSMQLSSSAVLQHLQTASKHHSSKSQTNVWAGRSLPLTPPLTFTSLLMENGTITKTTDCVGQENMLYLETDKWATRCLFFPASRSFIELSAPQPECGTGRIC